MIKSNLKKRVAVAAMAFGLCFSSAVPAQAATEKTKEFGTFSYSLTKSGNTVTAKTGCTKAAPTLITKLEVQDNATGKTLVNVTATKKNATSNNVVKAVNKGYKKLAAFTTHEARGKSSVAKYCSKTF